MQDNDDDEKLSFYLGPFIPGLVDEIVLSDGSIVPVECDDTSVIFTQAFPDECFDPATRSTNFFETKRICTIARTLLPTQFRKVFRLMHAFLLVKTAT